MEIKDILKKSRIPVQLLAYGRIELMVSEYCPIGSAFLGKNKSKGCNNICEKGNFSLIDRKGEEFPITTDKFCRSHILNTVPLNLIQYIKELEELGAYSFRIDFTDEDYKEVDKILKAFKNKKWKEDFKNYTRGHYKRGVE
ncbi:protease [Clostridium tetani 12124569]|nr:protease [Clostridium tetani 12124569]